MIVDWVGRCAVDIAAAVRAGEVSARQVVDEHLAHIAAVDHRVGAFEVVDHRGARAAADAVDLDPGRASLPLAGVPVGVKDVLDVAGLPTRHGSAGSPDTPAVQDDELVRRLRGAGAIVVGKTRVPELCLAAVSDNAFGVARNPWDLTRVPAGSSGGSAAAIASAQVPIAVGSDGGGSIRLPCAACGLVGIKPGEGTIPHRSDHPAAHWHGMSQYGPMGTTVADVALLLDVLAAHPVATLADPGALRIAVSERGSVARRPVHPEVRAGWRQAAATLAELGHETAAEDPVYPRWLMRAIAVRSFDGACHDARTLGLDVRLAGPRTRTVLRLGRISRRLAPVDVADANRWKRLADAFFESHDLLLTPATGHPAFLHRNWHDRGLLALVPKTTSFAAFTSPWNLADLPCAVVPMGVTSDGLPVCVQLVGGRGREDRVLAVAAQLEARHPWPRHAPGWLREPVA